MSDGTVEVTVSTTYRLTSGEWEEDVVLGSKSIYEFDQVDQTVEVKQ